MRTARNSGRRLSVLWLVAAVLLAACPSSGSAATAEARSLGKNAFVFVNGRYVPPPYSIHAVGHSIDVNGHELQLRGSEAAARQSERSPGKRHLARSRSRRSGTSVAERVIDNVEYQIGMNSVIVLFDREQPAFLAQTRAGQELIRTLLNRDSIENASDRVPSNVQVATARRGWAHLVSEFRPTPEFASRAKSHLQELELAQESNEKTSAAIIWVDRISYPLTMAAIVIVVLAFGHLLSIKPHLEVSLQDGNVDAQTGQAVGRSLLIVAMLSLVDLIWTLAASHAGSMRELNPIANQFINNPLQLVLFKIAAVTTAIGLLYWLRQRPIAQVASWWSCLVLTLVTARWLTFNSMFL